MIDERVVAEQTVTEFREEGFYWVRRYGETFTQVAKWSGLNWYLPGHIDPFTDDDMAFIGDRL